VIRRLAAAAAFLTVVLIVAGGVVTNTDSGLACPDWPTCFGSAMPKMVGSVAVEHTHRLIATAVGLCTLALVALTLRRARQGALAAALAGFCTLILAASFWAGRVKHVRDELPPLAVVLAVPLSLIGPVAVLQAVGAANNLYTQIGLILLIALSAKNGILMLDAVEDHLAAGDNLREALLRSGRRRFRPVLMTSLAAMLGMLPLALAFGAGSELLQPLAIGVIGGLTIALLLSLIVTPTVYAMLRRGELPK